MPPGEQTVQPPTSDNPQTIDRLAQGLDEAMRLLRRGRYPELEQHFRRFEQQALGLEALRRALQNGSAPPAGTRESCERLGRKLVVFSAVARQVAAVESGMIELLAGPGDSAYGRDGQCAPPGSAHFEQEA
jgi:hypothetical protein